MLTFGFTLIFLNSGRKDVVVPDGDDPPVIITQHFGSQVANMFLNQYMLLLGEFDTD